MPIEVGHEAPDVTLKNPDNEEVSLSSFRGARNVVLVFYPLAFSAICTKQFTALGTHTAQYAGANAQVIAVSVDSRHSQRVFKQQLGLPEDVLFLADFHPKGAAARAFGVYNEELGFATRYTFVIDAAGIVRYAAGAAPGDDIPDEDAVLAAAAACEV